MIRVFITSALLFLLPFILFTIYATVMEYLAKPAASDATGQPDPGAASAWRNPPIAWMAGIGTTLVLGTLTYLALTTAPSGNPGGTYYPPTVKDGKLQPGYVD